MGIMDFIGDYADELQTGFWFTLWGLMFMGIGALGVFIYTVLVN